MWRSRRGRAALAMVLLVFCSLGVASGVLHQQRQQADLELEETGEIEMEVNARGDWQPPRPPAPPQPAKAARLEPTRTAAERAEAERAAAAAQAQPVGPAREVKAAWYDVPDNSLAKRRAGREELTAAHNRLPIGTLVRVTHLSNGKSTLVRITDRGIRDKAIKLDVCREAAEELGMVSKGIARVKMEIVRERSGSSSDESQNNAMMP